MILQENQRVNIVVRGLMFKDDYLLATQWSSTGEAFPIGGRVEFGEPLTTSLRREVREETGAEIQINKLLYFGENVFTNQAGIHYHEYGWYFWVEPDRQICDPDGTIANPDHPDLIIRYLRVDDEGLSNFWPRFLRRFLPSDLAQGFTQNPRYIYGIDNQAGEIEIQELGELF